MNVSFMTGDHDEAHPISLAISDLLCRAGRVNDRLPNGENVVICHRVTYAKKKNAFYLFTTKVTKKGKMDAIYLFCL